MSLNRIVLILFSGENLFLASNDKYTTRRTRQNNAVKKAIYHAVYNIKAYVRIRKVMFKFLCLLLCHFSIILLKKITKKGRKLIAESWLCPKPTLANTVEYEKESKAKNDQKRFMRSFLLRR